MHMRIVNNSNGVCASNAFFGRCYADDQCDEVDHKATEIEATKILAAVKNSSVVQTNFIMENKVNNTYSNIQIT